MPNPSQDVLWLRNKALSSTIVSIAIADARSDDLPLIDVNPAFVRLTGYTASEAIGRNCRFLQGPRTDRNTAREMHDAIRETRESKSIILNYRKDGTSFWNEVTISPVFNSHDELTHFVATQMDVSQQVRNDIFRQLLIDIDSLLNNIAYPFDAIQPVTDLVVENYADLCTIHLVDETGDIRLAGHSLGKSVEPDGNLAALARRLTSSDTVPKIIRACVESGSVISRQFDASASSQPGLDSRPSVDYAYVIAPIVGPQRTFGAIAFRFGDRTRKLDSLDHELAVEIGVRAGTLFERGRLFAELKIANDVRDEFLSIAAHELRTPIASIKGYSQLLLRALHRGTLQQDRLKLGLQTIETSATRLTTLASDLLEVSRDGMNRVPLHLEQVSAFEYVTRFFSELRELDQHGHTFTVKGSDPGIVIDADLARLDQVLSNLASNAVKYAPECEIVDIEVRQAMNGVDILMTDQGIGLAQEDIEQIFQPFERTASAISSTIPGMGLGLFISRNIVEQHGGTLTAESSGPGQGTTFRIWLPASAESAVKATSSPSKEQVSEA
jgi:PAS domain S-box-containing protein